jgi:hypothetical protein
MKPKVLPSFIVLMLFTLSACVTQERPLLSYKNPALGISFDYPVEFEVYQQDENNLRVESDYKNPEKAGISIGMNIKKINPQRETYEQIENRLRFSGKSIISKESKGDYELLKINDNEYYILSDKGTFYIGDSTDTYKSILEEEGLYQDYKNKFAEIRNSIRIS